MNLEKKIYVTRAEKVKDFFIGFFLFYGLNILLGLCAFGLTALTGISADYVNFSFESVIGIALSCLPLLVNIGVMIFIGLKRIWITWGMLGGFAFGILITLIMVATCFALVFSVSY